MEELDEAFEGVSADQRRLAVVGWPLDYTLSPAMHNAAISFCGFRAVYRSLRVAPDRWDLFAQSLRAREGAIAPFLDGFNVTLPYKEKALSLVEGARTVPCGSINTLVNTSAGWRAHSTDGPGLLEDLRENQMEWTGRSVVVLGAGGAGRAALYALGIGPRRAASIVLVNRSVERARALAEAFARSPETSAVMVGSLGAETLARAELLINATSMGLRAEDSSPVPAEFLHRHLRVYDMIYHRPTALLRDAQAAGAPAVGGLGMLVAQGALAFEILFQDDLKKINYLRPMLKKTMASAAREALRQRMIS